MRNRQIPRIHGVNAKGDLKRHRGVENLIARPGWNELDPSQMDRIQKTFQDARQADRACFVAYLCAGDPDFVTSLQACRVLVEAGIDLLELGVPFSDPLADGITNQLAAQRALESGMTPGRVLDLVREIRKFSEIPIICYTYYNLVYANGLAGTVRAMGEAGVDGILTLDLPPEEASDYLASCSDVGLKTVFIVAPTTPEGRLERIASSTTGFLYYVSRTGVTGVQSEMSSDIGTAVATIRRHTELPIVVGFGISNPGQVTAIAGVADGVVVGSALVRCFEDAGRDAKASLEALDATVRGLLAGL
jgi:tryptophan synthase alpha chain